MPHDAHPVSEHPPSGEFVHERQRHDAHAHRQVGQREAEQEAVVEGAQTAVDGEGYDDEEVAGDGTCREGGQEDTDGVHPCRRQAAVWHEVRAADVVRMSAVHCVGERKSAKQIMNMIMMINSGNDCDGDKDMDNVL